MGQVAVKCWSMEEEFYSHKRGSHDIRAVYSKYR